MRRITFYQISDTEILIIKMDAKFGLMGTIAAAVMLSSAMAFLILGFYALSAILLGISFMIFLSMQKTIDSIGNTLDKIVEESTPIELDV